MLVLLPPSETKAPSTRGKPMDWESLSFPALTWARQQVADALTELGDGSKAARALGVPEGKIEELTHNLNLDEAHATRASELYTGVLYDALDLPRMEPPVRRRASQRLLIFSGLYGVLKPQDKVAPYRLGMGVNLPGIGPLAGYWREQLDGVVPAKGWFVDCRSQAYTAAWQPPADRWVQVRVTGASHWAKKARGHAARLLCETPHTPKGLDGIVAVLAAAWGDGVRVGGTGPFQVEIPAA